MFCHTVDEQANRWWLHLFRLLTGEWGGDQQGTKDILRGSSSGTTAQDSVQEIAAASVERVFASPDWPSARGFLPDWLWCGLVTETAGKGKDDGDSTSESGMDKASLDHARGESCYVGSRCGAWPRYHHFLSLEVLSV